VALQGTLDTFALPDVLRLLAATKKTGRLRISGSRGNGSVWVDAGGVVGSEASGAPHAFTAVEVVFELLRFTEGSFSFDADERHVDPDVSADVEPLLDEWRAIESVVPSLDAYVRLAREASGEVSLDRAQWRTVAAIGSGTSVRRLADDLSFSEIPVCRAVKELVELGLADVDASAVAEPASLSPMVDPQSARAELDALAASLAANPAGVSAVADPDVFVPLDLSHLGSSTHGRAPAAEPTAEPSPEAMFPGLAAQAATLAAEARDAAETGDDEMAGNEMAGNEMAGNEMAGDEMGEDELAKQLATLSPRAAKAVQAAAEATTDEEREAAIAAVEADADEPLNRGLLLKFLSSVRS
jgi:hypothetical protein